MVIDHSSSHSTQFRRFHAREILATFDLLRGPLDFFISLYFRNNRQLGSKDRGAVSELVYHYFRHKIFLEALHETAKSSLPLFDYALPLLEAPGKIAELIQTSDLPLALRFSLPDDLYMLLERSWPHEIEQLALALTMPAPLTIRTNTLKIMPEELVKRLQQHGITAHQDAIVREALHIPKKCSLFHLDEFQSGFFEIQDIGSQRIAKMIEVRPKQSFLDYCAGSGGKTLAVAPKMEGSGQIYLHDIRDKALLEAKKRLARAGVQNSQRIRSSERAKLSKLTGKMDWVLVDAPCSGTGTVRRNPDMKYKFSLAMVERLQQEQRNILREAACFLKSGGRLVFATCSLLREENQDTIAFAKKELNLEVDESSDFSEPAILATAPHIDGADGFFAVRLRQSP